MPSPQSLAKDVVSGQYNFSQDELNYIANNWMHTDHDQLYTASGGVSYRWLGTLFSVDATFGSGLRSGFANTDQCRATSRSIWGRSASLSWGACGPMEARLAVINVLDKINEIRSGTGIGIFAPQYGPRIGFFGGISKYILTVNGGEIVPLHNNPFDREVYNARNTHSFGSVEIRRRNGLSACCCSRSWPR